MPMDIPPKLAPFFADLDILNDAQPALFAGGFFVVCPAVPSNAILPENTGDLHLDNIEADAPGQGWGRAAMRLLTDLADRHGLAIYLRAAVGAEDGIEIEGGPIDQEALEDFYAKFGFIDTGSWGCRDMLRRPKPFEVDAQDRLRHAFAGRPVWQVKPEATSRPSP